MVEPSLENAKAGDKFQFVRLGYFTVDSKYPHRFNRIVELKGSFKA
jgi:glutaminyl-tRNA synthetase